VSMVDCRAGVVSVGFITLAGFIGGKLWMFRLCFGRIGIYCAQALLISHIPLVHSSE